MELIGTLLCAAPDSITQLYSGALATVLTDYCFHVIKCQARLRKWSRKWAAENGKRWFDRKLSIAGGAAWFIQRLTTKRGTCTAIV